ncbi:hypothetical protein DFH06DRAFT_1139231 [Mycena polygramma]|nr:hypothetical protein DFH06DRAFT_1139231 [Mycena polygramma]
MEPNTGLRALKSLFQGALGPSARNDPAQMRMHMYNSAAPGNGSGGTSWSRPEGEGEEVIHQSGLVKNKGLTRTSQSATSLSSTKWNADTFTTGASGVTVAAVGARARVCVAAISARRTAAVDSTASGAPTTTLEKTKTVKRVQGPNIMVAVWWGYVNVNLVQTGVKGVVFWTGLSPGLRVLRGGMNDAQDSGGTCIWGGGI